jgi:cytohesin
LGHILRFDAAVNILQILAQAVFWFHPFVWWANRKIRAEREKCCDEMAIARLGAKAKDYSDAIVNILISEHESTRPVPSLAVAGPVKNIEERIKTMLKPGKKFYKRPSLIAATFVFLLALLTVPTALVLTARAEEKKTASESGEKPSKSLHRAAATGDIDQVKLLISKGTDVNEKTTTGDTALHYAARHNHNDVAELLIKKGADVNAKNKNGDTPAHIALREHMREHDKPFLVMEMLDLLIAKGANLSCIQLSAYQGELAKVRSFVEQGTDVDARDSDGATALHYAALRGNQDVVEFLVGRGADVNAKDKVYGFIPLHYVDGIHADGIHVVELFIAKGANVNAKDRWGWTPLDSAAESGRLAVAKLLIKAGANVNSRYAWGQTPLDWAADRGHTAVVQLLIAKGANVNAKDNQGRTPLMKAARQGHEEVVKLLIAKGADINAEAYFSRGTVLAQAAIGGHMNVVKVLLAKGADVNAGAHTPLHGAASSGHKDIVNFLIAKGADVNAKDYDGRTPLSLAKEKGHSEIVELLRKQGAKD